MKTWIYTDNPGNGKYVDRFQNIFLPFNVCLSGSNGEEFACNAGDLGLIRGLGKSPGEGNGYPLQYSCLENSMDRGV